ncbi:hypothetical protein L218DRAFT_951829 [Marasmius fiardii PR-910]|nr:hypothetical protein L218DRAFT_951829 [Marasmius fiardii PR-910]
MAHDEIPEFQESWRDLMPEQDAEALDKGKHVRYPHGFEAHSSEDWQGFMDIMENAFHVKSVVSGEAKIYLALQILKSVKRQSWQRFKEEVFEQWDVDIKFRSLSKLKKIVKIHQEIDNDTSDSEFNKYQREFKNRMIEKILHSLQLKLAAKLENEDATMKERWRQDPWLLGEVMKQVEVTVKSGIGGTYIYGLMKNFRSLFNHSQRLSSSSSESRSKQKVWFEEPSKGSAGLTSLAASASKAAKILAENPNIKFEDEETMHVKSMIDSHGTQIWGLQESIAQYNTQLDQTEQKMANSFAEVKAMIIQSRIQPTQLSGPSQSFAQSAGSAPPTRMGGNCYMCNGQGHISTKCDWQKEYIKWGWIKIDPKSGQWVLKDGTPMPSQKEGDPDPWYSKIERIAREANWDRPSEAKPLTKSFYQGNSLEALSDDIFLRDEDANLLDNIMWMFINAKHEAKKQSKESKN